jgi:hypothetical protein
MQYQEKKNSFFSDWRETLQVLVFALLCALIFLAFPLSGIAQGSTTLFAFLVITPILFVKIILKNDLDSIGVFLGNPKAGFVWGGMMLVASLLLGFAISKTSYLNIFSLPVGVATDFKLFLLYELVLANLVLLAIEFFFHGFIISSLMTKLKGSAIIISGILFLIFLILTNNLRWIAIIFPGGIVAYKSKSFFYAYLMSLLFMIFFDTYLIFISK